jgi:hypothetical protein
VAEYVTKDSGIREAYETGMVRDSQEGKPRFDLLWAEHVPFTEQFLTRVAGLAQRGADKYGERNHERSRTQEELSRFRASALRHLMQWIAGETDEDHMAAVVMNLFMAETCAWKMLVSSASDRAECRTPRVG